MRKAIPNLIQMGKQTDKISFGTWLRRQRRGRDLSRQALADQVGCAEITLRRIESGSLKPSRELARLLLEQFEIAKEELESWILFARGVSGIPKQSDDAAPTSSRSNLPVFLTHFVGREKEQDEIIQLLNKNRLVTLTGPGGVGKTRLAGVIGEHVVDQYPDGIWMVELAPLNDPQLVPQAVAGLFGMAAQTKIPYTDLLVNFLRSKNILIILDNCEHLMQACAQLTESLLKGCPNVKMLATSREPLQIMGEAIYHVPSLAIPDEPQSLKKYKSSEAVHLFEERAQLALSSFSLTMENASTVIQICRRLDGIPLAIELAAARVDILSVEQIAERLHESFDLLTGGSRTVLPRQQTIRGSMDWSWDLLSEEERALLRRLSIFSGGWTLDAAEAICSGNGIEVQQVAGLMLQLAAKSLIVVNQGKTHERRYGLHEIIRQYAREKMDEAEEDVIRSQHLEYFLDFAEQAEPALYGPDQMTWVARLNAEMDNIRSAFDWAGKRDLEAGLYMIGRLYQNIDLREVLHWAAEFLGKPESHAHPRARARALQAQADCMWITQQFEAARIACEESLDLYQAYGDREGEFGCLITLGSVYQYMEGMDKKNEFQNQALALARSMEDLPRQASALNGLGWDRRDPQRANEYWDQAIALYRQIGDWRNLIFLLGVYGDTLLANGDVEAAHRLLDEAVALNDRINYRRGVEFVLVAKSREALLAGEYAQARTYLQEWLEVAENMGNRMGYLWGRARLGYVELLAGDLEEGSDILYETAREFHMDQNKVGLAFTLEKLAYLFTRSNLTVRAAQLIGWADKIRAETGDIRSKFEQANVDRELAACISHLGQEAVNEALNRGRTMTLDEAAALALG